MGKGDGRSKRGKIWRKSYGKTRPSRRRGGKKTQARPAARPEPIAAKPAAAEPVAAEPVAAEPEAAEGTEEKTEREAAPSGEAGE